ncbi:MAG: tryptophan 7-halogenase, partial [Planctomycetaceae bacterium]|nr:tryptophan 7-halogenase [Planctomycetaceae bacterium]
WDHVAPTRKWLGNFDESCKEHPFPSDDSAVHHLFHDGWMWQLRFENGLTSLGFVSHGGFNEKIKAGTPEQAWACLLESKPSLAGLLSQAQLAPFPGHVYRSGRLQRLRACASGVDWAALPFSAGFIDPLHSTGIAHTLSGVEKLSRILFSESGQQQVDSLKQYSQCLIDEFRLIDLLVAGCYESLANFSLFTAWTMLYFAAATTYEKKYQQDRCDSPDFLCASEADFVELVHQLFADLRNLPKEQSREAKQAVENFILTMRKCLVPFNHVGLFEPEIPNMYRYTSAKKH